METRPEAIVPPLATLLLVSVCALAVMLDRIEAPTRA
jgi:hypothetical protein